MRTIFFGNLARNFCTFLLSSFSSLFAFTGYVVRTAGLSSLFVFFIFFAFTAFTAFFAGFGLLLSLSSAFTVSSLIFSSWFFWCFSSYFSMACSCFWATASAFAFSLSALSASFSCSRWSSLIFLSLYFSSTIFYLTDSLYLRLSSLAAFSRSSFRNRFISIFLFLLSSFSLALFSAVRPYFLSIFSLSSLITSW